MTLGHLRRSQLPAAAKNGRIMEQAARSEADQVILDLEDSVPANEKVEARDRLVMTLNGNDWTDSILSCRINDVKTRWWYEDVIRIVTEVGEHLDTVVLPKVDEAGDVYALDKLLTQVERNAGLPVGHLGVEVQIETAAGMSNVVDIAESNDRLEALIFGPGDYSASVGASRLHRQRGEAYPGHYWHYPLSRIVHAGKAAGLQVIDGLYADVDDEEGFRTMCQWASMLGCDGKWAIHPTQIAIANEVFAPSEEEARYAKRIVDAYTGADGTGGDVVTVDGEIVDEATYEMAEQILERARQADVI